jgi:hypothetical protein
MGGGMGGFYQGEKKKKKKDIKTISSAFSGGMGAPTFTLPKLVEKKKRDF